MRHAIAKKPRSWETFAMPEAPLLGVLASGDVPPATTLFLEGIRKKNS